MPSTETQAAAAEEGEAIAIDPFSFFPELASRIAGLGGKKTGHDPRYLFHTPYVVPRPGRASFTIVFDNLRAQRGTLVLSINMFPIDGRSEAQLVTTERITFEHLVLEGGSITIGFEGFRDMSFAILGQIPDDTDVTAGALRIFLNNPPVLANEHLVADGLATAFGSDTLRSSPFITDVALPSFVDPVSQVYTLEQTRDPAFTRWAAYLNVTGQLTDWEVWQEAYVLQALKRYGMLEPGARALGLAVGRSMLPAIIAQQGILVTATDPMSPDANEKMAAEAYLAEMRPRAGATHNDKLCYRVAEPLHLPPDLVDFDLLWSVGLLPLLGGIGGIISATEDGLRCLRPGGIAISTFQLYRAPGAGLVSAADIERLALVLISKGHQVARLKFARPKDSRTRVDDPKSVPFGLIIRRAESIY